MEYLTEIFARITGSKILLAAFITPAIVHGICHWIVITKNKAKHKLIALFMIPEVVSYIFLAAHELWAALALAIIFERVGRYTITPFLDLFWNYHHYGNPFQSFFLSENRTLGPSTRLHIEERFRLYDLDFQFNIPPSNLSPGWTQDIHGVTDESRTVQGKYFAEVSEIREWRKYFWSARDKRYTKQAQLSSNENIKLSIIEVELVSTLISGKNTVQTIVAELILHHLHTKFIAAGTEYIKSIVVNSPSIDGMLALTVNLSFETTYRDLGVDFLFLQKTQKKLIVFCIEDYGKDGKFILEQIKQTLKICPISQESALEDFSVDPRLNVTEFNQVIRSTAEVEEERTAAEATREEELREQGWREVERIFEQAKKDHGEAENSNSA